MWQLRIGEQVWGSTPTPAAWRASRWALLAAGTVLLLPVALLALTAAVIGATVFGVVMLGSLLYTLARRTFDQLRGADESGRVNVRVIRREA